MLISFLRRMGGWCVGRRGALVNFTVTTRNFCFRNRFIVWRPTRRASRMRCRSGISVAADVVDKPDGPASHNRDSDLSFTRRNVCCRRKSRDRGSVGRPPSFLRGHFCLPLGRQVKLKRKRENEKTHLDI